MRSVNPRLVLLIVDMSRRGLITTSVVLLCLILGLLSPAPAASGSRLGRACCTKYNRRPIPFQRIKGYREQTMMEKCRIDAIIFYTVKNHEICATREDEWVRKILELLSSKLKKMSKPATGGDLGKEKEEKTPVKEGNESLLSTMETYSNSTESFY